jgi:hypothetical protein
MPWIIGIDEAGYGPNLGPFVMTSVALRVPDEHIAADLWDVLRDAVRRHPTADDGRLLIEDSKVVYSTARGLLDLETSVLATLPLELEHIPSLTPLVHRLCPEGHAELGHEIWYTGGSTLPVVAQPAEFAAAAARFASTCATAQVVRGLVRSVIICPPRFNQLLDHWGSKGAVLAHGLAELVQCNRGLDGDTLRFFVDKHGGRNTYTAILQHAFADGLVVADEERLARSSYRVLGLDRGVGLTFQPRADAEHFCVALASMVSKYLREVLMAEFNRFWQEQVPGLKPTAGYPGDAARFLAAIRPALERLGLAEDALWRRK